MKIKDFVRGDGPKIAVGGYHRGDSWVQITGPHSEHDGKVTVIGPGAGLDATGTYGPGVLVRCGGCLMSWVIR